MVRESSILRKVLFVIVATGLGVVSAVFGAEMLIRIMLPLYSPGDQMRLVDGPYGLPVLEHRNGFKRHWKNTGDFDVLVYSNQDGFRTGDAVPTGQSKAQVLFLGDSFGFGWGVEQRRRYSDIYEAKLTVSVANFSTPSDFDGYESQIRYARDKGVSTKRAIISVCMENDLKIYPGGGDLKRASSIERVDFGTDDVDEQTENESEAAVFSRLISKVLKHKSWFAQHSAVYNLLTSSIHRSPSLRRLAIERGLIDPNIAMGIHPATNEQILSSVDRLFRLINDYQLDALVMLIPSRYMWAGLSEKEEHRRVHDQFLARLTDRGLLVVDMRKHFESHGPPMRYYFENDGHWNEAGHKLAAESLVLATEQRKPAWLIK